MTKIDMLPVPPELVPRVWRSAYKVTFSKIPGFDIPAQRTRLLIGHDRLWVAYGGYRYRALLGVVITHLSNRPPSKRRCFKRDDPALMRSLKIHVAGEYDLRAWLDSAIERINRYAREHAVRQLFFSMRKGFQKHIARLWWSPEWEGVAVSRDRKTKSTCRRHANRNTPGYYRPLVPLPPEKFTRHYYGFTGTAYFKQEAK
jgi:hypothetical protein